jgi:predicted MFS family arabinose efflux permease
MAQSVGAGWMMVVIAPSDILVALVQASTSLPVMLFSLLTGAMADSIDRRRQMIAGQLLMFLTSVVLTATTYAGVVTPALLLACTFLIGCGTALHLPATQASVRDLVPREQIPSAVALNSMSYNVTRSVGPALGGMLVALAGPAAAFAANAVSYLPVLASLLLWDNPRTVSNRPREPLFQAVVTGLRYVARSQYHILLMARAFLFSLAGVSVLALLPLVTRDGVGGGASVYGALLSSFGIGAVAGVFAGLRMRAVMGNENLVRATSVVFAVSLTILAISKSQLLTCFCLLMIGACWVATMSLFNTAVQVSTPQWVIGRSMSIYQTATFGGMAVGSWFWGMITAATSLTAALLAASACIVASLAPGLRQPLPPELDLGLQEY